MTITVKNPENKGRFNMRIITLQDTPFAISDMGKCYNGVTDKGRSVYVLIDEYFAYVKDATNLLQYYAMGDGWKNSYSYEIL